jgi:glycerol uptake facilitator-like aquaporin
VNKLNAKGGVNPVTLLSMWVYVSGPLMGGVTAGLASRAISLLY